MKHPRNSTHAQECVIWNVRHKWSSMLAYKRPKQRIHHSIHHVQMEFLDTAVKTIPDSPLAMRNGGFSSLFEISYRNISFLIKEKHSLKNWTTINFQYSRDRLLSIFFSFIWRIFIKRFLFHSLSLPKTPKINSIFSTRKYCCCIWFLFAIISQMHITFWKFHYCWRSYRIIVNGFR